MNFDALIEGKIYSISIAKESDVHAVLISMVDNDRNAWVLTASAVSDLLVEEMRLQNIIEQVSVFDESCIDSEDVRKKIFFLLRGKHPDSKDDLVWDGVEKVVSDIFNGRSCLLEIAPVCGAYVLLIAKSLSLKKG